MYFDDEDERYYEPSLTDEILAEFSEKMKGALLDSVKADIETLKRTNEALKTENKQLQENRDKVNALELSVKYEKENLMRTVRRERLGEIMKDFQIVMYKVDNEGKKTPKCNKCDKDRKISFESPTGKKLTESCKCDKNINYYVPETYECSEFRMDRYKNKILMWYKQKEYDRDNDYYSRTSSDMAEHIYNETMKYEDLNSYSTYFRSEEECQKYCDWLNSNKKKGD